MDSRSSNFRLDSPLSRAKFAPVVSYFSHSPTPPVKNCQYFSRCVDASALPHPTPPVAYLSLFALRFPFPVVSSSRFVVRSLSCVFTEGAMVPGVVSANPHRCCIACTPGPLGQLNQHGVYEHSLCHAEESSSFHHHLAKFIVKYDLGLYITFSGFSGRSFTPLVRTEDTCTRVEKASHSPD